MSLDVTQQTFLKILNDNNILSLQSPKAYLFTVARNTLYNVWIKKKEYQLTKDDQAEQIPDEKTVIPDDDATQIDIKKKIEIAIRSLPEKSRELMLLHYSEGLSYQEIVNVTGRKLSDVKVNLHRARHRFDKIFTTQMYRKVAASRNQCDEVSAMLTPYKDKDIPDSQVDEIDKHITRCKICVGDAQQMKRTRQLFSILPLFLAPSILDQLFNQSLGVALASSTAGVTSTVATGTSKLATSKIVASAVVVFILTTGGYLLAKPNKEQNIPDTTVLLAHKKKTITKPPISNKSTKASIQTLKPVIAGARFNVIWSGPNNQYDYLGVFKKNTTTDYSNYQFTHNNKTIALIAPEVAGEYDILYKSAKENVWAKTPLTVLAANTSIKKLKAVTKQVDIENKPTKPWHGKYTFDFTKGKVVYAKFSDDYSYVQLDDGERPKYYRTH